MRPTHDLQARQKWVVVGGQGKPTVFVFERQPLYYHKLLVYILLRTSLSHLFSIHTLVCCMRTFKHVFCANSRLTSAWQKRHNSTSARPSSSSRLASSHGNAFAQDSEYQKLFLSLRKAGRASSASSAHYMTCLPVLWQTILVPALEDGSLCDPSPLRLGRSSGDLENGMQFAD